MEEIVIGRTRIPVIVRENSRLKRSRLSVDTNGVLVETPSGTKQEVITSFLEQRVEWIFHHWDEFRGKSISSVWPERFVSGAKVMFLGRFEPIEVRTGDGFTIQHSTKGFSISVRDHTDQIQIKSLIIDYYQDYLTDLLQNLVNGIGMCAIPAFRFTQRKDRWAYCDERKILHVGWDLAFLPKKLIEYVLIHELCHLKHMNHDKEFWQEVGRHLPEQSERKQALVEFERLYGF